jgi:ferrochelatase
MKVGVLLLQMGGPANLAEVEPFLYNLFCDPYIIQLPWFMKPFQNQFAGFVSERRAPKVQKLYAEIGGGSPIRFETEAQAIALAKYLNKRGDAEYLTYIAMRYSNPRLSETLEQIQKDNIDELFVIPMYPQYSLATSGSSVIECKQLFAACGLDRKIKINYIESWYDQPEYIDLIVSRIITELQALEADGVSAFEPPRARVHILFSAHGLPVSYVAAGDPYQEQVKATVRKVMGRLPLYRHSISYQSRVGPVKWLQPATEREIKRLAREEGVRNLIVVPISFVGDHIETLSEINIEYKEYAEEQGIERFRVTRLPKANPLLVEALAAKVWK